MEPFIPPPPPEGLIPVLVRNNTTIPTRIKIYHQHMLQPPEGPGFVQVFTCSHTDAPEQPQRTGVRINSCLVRQVLLSAGQSQPVKVPGLSGHALDPRTGCNRLVKMRFTVQFEQVVPRPMHRQCVSMPYRVAVACAPAVDNQRDQKYGCEYGWGCRVELRNQARLREAHP